MRLQIMNNPQSCTLEDDVTCVHVSSDMTWAFFYYLQNDCTILSRMEVLYVLIGCFCMNSIIERWKCPEVH